MSKSIRNWIAVAALIALYGAAAQFFFGYLCLSQIAVGLPCPACGLTRAFLMLLGGQFRESWRMNPMLIFIPPYFALAWFKFRKLSQVYLVGLIVISFVVFGFRLRTSFGTEPLVLNDHAMLARLLRR